MHVSLILHGTPIVCMAAWGYIANMHLESIVHGMLYIHYWLSLYAVCTYVHTYIWRLSPDSVYHDICMCVVVLHFMCIKKMPIVCYTFRLHFVKCAMISDPCRKG